MKKAVLFLLFGFILSGCATNIGLNDSLNEEKYYRARTLMEPACVTEGKGIVDGTKCIAMGMVTASTLGIYSPYYYEFHEYADDKVEAENKSRQACEDYKKKKKWEGKVVCHTRSFETPKGELKSIREARKKKDDEKDEKTKIELTSMLDTAKTTCKELGFKEQTEKFSECALKLYSQSVELAAKNNQQVVMQSQSSGSNVMTIYDPVRDNNALMDKGMKMLSGRCTLGIDC
jgi:hypothetical protein